MQSSQAEVIGEKYRLGEHIYGSALSWVYEASFVRSSRKANQIPLILKTIPRMRQDKSKILSLKERVLSEAQALASLDNPFIVKAIDYGEDANMPYLVMRRRSMNLGQYLQINGKMSLVTAIPLLHNLATALDYAHKQGFIHRDIKPDNILLDLDAAGKPLYAYITDFGIAQFPERPFRTETNGIIGTMAYMPPERLEGRETTNRSDVYSFGLVAYEILAGVSLFGQVEVVQDQMSLILNPTPEFLQSAKSSLDPDVAARILKAISRKPENRYPSATEFTTSLGQLLPASQLALVNQAIERNLQEAGRADELALALDEKEGIKFSLLWISMLLLCLFGLGFLWAQFSLYPDNRDYPTPVVAFAFTPTAEASEDQQPIVPSLSPEPSPTANPTESPTVSPSNTSSITPSASPSPSPSATFTASASPTISRTPLNTRTPRPEVNCEGASWIYHEANRGDSLSHYVYSLINNPVFANMDYEQREALILRVNHTVDFDPLATGQRVCLPSVPPLYLSQATPTVLATGGGTGTVQIINNPEPSSGSGSSGSGSNSASGSGGSGSGGSGSSSGSGSGSGSSGQATQVSPPPTDVPVVIPPTTVPINVSISVTCTNGNSGSTTFQLTNNSGIAVSISWRIMEGSTQITSGNLPLGLGGSANAWSGNTKNKNYTLIINETGASSGESCG